jgi:hypothetical protein
MGQWLMARGNLFTNKFISETAVVYDQRSAFERQIFECDNLEITKETGFSIFHRLCQELCTHGVLFNVIYISSEEPLTCGKLNEYRNIFMPDVVDISDIELRHVLDWENNGGRIASMGRVHSSLEQFALPPGGQLSDVRDEISWLNQNHHQFIVQLDQKNVGMSVHQTATGCTLHLVNYNLDNVTRKIETLDLVRYQLAFSPQQIRIHGFPEPSGQFEYDHQTGILSIRQLGIYTIIEFQEG